jgi:hypothetical protein
MGSDRLYVIFLTIVIISKIFYLISTIRMRTMERVDPKSDKLAAIKDRNQRILIGGEVLMFILLMIIFRPWQSHKNVIINRHEQLIFFVLGILGLVHSDWSLLLLDK